MNTLLDFLIIGKGHKQGGNEGGEGFSAFFDITKGQLPELLLITDFLKKVKGDCYKSEIYSRAFYFHLGPLKGLKGCLRSVLLFF